jgi:hypothetical protein
MVQMKRKVLLVPFIAVLTLLVVGLASAGDLVSDPVSIELNGEDLTSGELAGFAGEVVPVRVSFLANENSTDVKVRVSIYDGRDEVTDVTGRFNIVDGSRYSKLLSLRLPSGLDEELDDLTLTVEIYDADHGTDDFDTDYGIRMQRESYELDVLAIDYNTRVSAGDVFPVVVVLKNVGFERADDNFVVASVPELGISSRGYAGDLIPTEDYDDDYDDEEDSTQKTVYLKIPENTASGVYELEVKVFNDDTETVITRLVNVGSASSTTVLASAKNQDVNAGETKTYDLVIVNSAKNVKVFNIQTISGPVLAVSAPTVVTVGPDSSEVVPVSVAVSRDAAVGTYTFSVDVDGEQVVLGANVTGKSVSTSVVALTVILVIIFVVLLAVLVILLTRKEQPIEEVETSYY